MSDIARELGVAASTVSRALTNHPSIPEETRARVRAAAERLGYRPDPVMSSLAARRWARAGKEAGAAMAFLLLGAKRVGKSLHLEGARAAAEKLGYHLEVFCVSGKASERQTARVIKARGIRGVVVRYGDPSARLPEWDWSSFAVVCCGEPPEDETRLDTVELAITDNHQMIARECLRRGYRRPGLVFAGPRWLRSEHRRVGGLTTPYWEAGLKAPPFLWWDGKDVAAIRAWLKRERADAVITMTASQAVRLKAEGIVGKRGLPCLCMQLLPGDPEDLDGVRANFAGVGEMAVRLCDMGIRQNRFGLPESPTVMQVRPRVARSESESEGESGGGMEGWSA